ncbi:MAG: hypothetical protein LW710_06765 [Burkholderiales bacterium]|jgi:hypothetical protein|uniref:hypothetical protein n=1 Tax=Limnobacter sp. TaxID=2003368 RepID=UPI00395555CB|nr:hypothetical protein [Burkholderiales bacterium]
MTAVPSGVNSPSNAASKNAGLDNTANRAMGKKPAAGQGVSKASMAIWTKLSENLVSDPAGNWGNALANAQELARSVCGQNLPPDLQADLLQNFKLLEKTLIGLNISPSNGCPDPKAFIKDQFLAFKLNIVTDAKDLETLESIRNNLSN